MGLVYYDITIVGFYILLSGKWLLMFRIIILSSSLRSSNSIGVIRSIGNYLTLRAVQTSLKTLILSSIPVRTSYLVLLIHLYHCLVRSYFFRKSWRYLIRVLCDVQYYTSATSWSLVQRSPTDCSASLCVIWKLRKWGGPGPLGTVMPNTNK
jgi:hypothetical protein